MDDERRRELWFIERDLAAAAMPSNFSDVQGKTLADANAKLQVYRNAWLDATGESLLGTTINWRAIHSMAVREDPSVLPYGHERQWISSNGEWLGSVIAFMGERDRIRLAADPDTSPIDLDSMSSDVSPAVREAASKNPARGHAASGGGCYIATAVYGSYEAPEVRVLRRWRDNSLASSALGRQFVRVYYATSPRLVRTFGGRTWFTVSSRSVLDQVVVGLRRAGYSEHGNPD